MGAFLRAQHSFSIQTKTETDEVLDSGQKIQLSGTTELEVRRPNRMRATMSSDRKKREFFYDGKNFTVFSPRSGYYATVSAPPTLADLADTINQKYGIETPLADLFYWGTERQGFDQITDAVDIGPSRIDGVDTEQYAFRQPGLDWQIWIERGDRPLPHKLVLTTTDDPARPQHSVEIGWTLGVRQDAATFTFVPPPGSQRIEIVGPPTEAPAQPTEAPAPREVRR